MFILPLYALPLEVGSRGISAFNGRRLIEIIWLAGLLATLLHPRLRPAVVQAWEVLPSRARIAAALLLVLSLLSSLLASAPAYALREWALLAVLSVALLPLVAVLPARRAAVAELVGLTLVLYALLIIGTPLEHGFANPRFQGQALAAVAPALLFSGNPLLAVMAGPAVGLGVLNGSRALLLTLLFITVTAVLLWPDWKRRVLSGLTGFAIAGVVVGILMVLGHQESVSQAVERGTGLTGRGRLWRETLGVFLEAPLMGIGPGMLARSPGGAGWAAQPHNSVLMVAAETGIAGLACVGLLLWQGLRRLPGLDPDRRPWALALLAGGFHSLFSGTVVMPASQSLLLLALAMVLPRPHSAVAPVPRRATGWILLAVGIAAMVVLLATLSLPPVHPPRFGGPRFFSPGIIP